LVDPVPLHVDQARARAIDHAFRADLGDARSLAFPDEAFDAVLLFGPLYHLMEAEERLTALREALRVVRPGGLIVGAVICRFAALLDGIREQWFRDGAHLAKIVASLPAGALPDAIGTAFLHRPEEVRAEAERAGLSDIQVLAIEGPFWLLPDIDIRASDPEQWDLLLTAIRAIESEPLTLGASNHLLVAGTKP
jgi:SAM-dependent methyltransferase